MASNVVVPDTRKLDLGRDEYLIVKKRLNAGERRKHLARMVKDMHPGEHVTLNPEQVGLSKAVSYLVDWNQRDPKGDVIQIRGKSVDDVVAALDSLDPEVYDAIIKAIDAHEDAMDAEREKEKNAQAGETPSSAISELPA